ncbi:Leucine carboxyl methyltransferase 1 [Spathaspora sp. JA1]|nr:Leucine carboxyl methyltransferase 1 [Spathaspora sp. JA1]
MLSPKDKQDKLIRATDLDALSCRHNINSRSYLIPSDIYISKLIDSYHQNLQYCYGYTNLSSSRALRLFNDRKLPLINRGTYLRTIAIDNIVHGFIEEFGKCQIVSLGSGSDTRAFSILNKYSEVIYHEIDFPESVKIKKLAIYSDNELQKIVGLESKQVPVINSRDTFVEFDCDLQTSRYHLHGIDIRTWKDLKTPFAHFDQNLPTLVISECVLCYLSPDEYENTINYLTAISNNLISFVIYEPMSLNDSFGLTMTKNLLDRGLNLMTFNKYPDLQSRREFLAQNCKLTNLRLTDMSNVGGYSKNSQGDKQPWVELDTLKRINSLEFIDEIEEIKLLLEHYCLIYGDFNRKSSERFSGIDKWSWVVT